MRSENKIILVGGFHEIIELCEICSKKIIGIIDNKLSGTYYGYRIIGGDKDADNLYNKYGDISVILVPDKPSIRLKLKMLYGSIGYSVSSVIHPSLTLSRTAKIGEGVIIHGGVNISSMVTIGDFARINVGANIMHDCSIGEFTTVAPNAVILGRVTIQKGCYIGANATILPNVNIGENAVIAAGAVVTKNVKNAEIVKGNPARRTGL